MRVLAYRTNNKSTKGEIIEIDNSLEAMQGFVNGYIETVSLPNGLVVVCDEEGRIKNYPYCISIIFNNLPVSFVGNVFICGIDNGEFREITDDEINKIYSHIQR